MAKSKFDKLVPGQTVWTIRRQKMGNTTVSYNALYEIRVVEIDREKGRVLASWNSNKPQWFGRTEVSKWKLERPEPKKTIFGLSSY